MMRTTMRTMMRTKQVRNRLAGKVRLIQSKEFIILLYIGFLQTIGSVVQNNVNGTLIFGGLIDMID